MVNGEKKEWRLDLKTPSKEAEGFEMQAGDQVWVPERFCGFLTKALEEGQLMEADLKELQAEVGSDR